MKAKEMFKKLGYVVHEETKYKLVYTHTDFYHYIAFVKWSKTVCSYSRNLISETDEWTTTPIGIAGNELKAINQQMEELGWIE